MMTALSCMLIWAMGMLKLLLKVRKLARPPRVKPPTPPRARIPPKMAQRT